MENWTLIDFFSLSDKGITNSDGTEPQPKQIQININHRIS